MGRKRAVEAGDDGRSGNFCASNAADTNFPFWSGWTLPILLLIGLLLTSHGWAVHLESANLPKAQRG